MDLLHFKDQFDEILTKGSKKKTQINHFQENVEFNQFNIFLCGNKIGAF